MYFGGKRSGGKKEKEIESVEEIEDRVYHIKFECEQGIYIQLHAHCPLYFHALYFIHCSI